MQVTKISKHIFQGIPYLNTVTVTAVTPSGEQTVLWRVRSLTDNEWHYAHTPLPLGYYQLNFQFSGREFRGGFDDVTVRLGNCSEHSEYETSVNPYNVGKNERVYSRVNRRIL